MDQNVKIKKVVNRDGSFLALVTFEFNGKEYKGRYDTWKGIVIDMPMLPFEITESLIEEIESKL